MFNWFYAFIGVAIGISGGLINIRDTQGVVAAPRWTWHPMSKPIVNVLIFVFLIFSATFGLQWFFIALAEIIIGMIVGKVLNRM
jgi:uncharacterized membrane-anchored protein YhcB (DUF1043 family)